MYDARTRRTLGAALAAAFLAGPWDEPGLIARGAEALRPRPRWLRRVVRVVPEHYHRPPADRPRELAAFVAVVLERERDQPNPPHVRRWFVWEPAMADRRPWAVPELDSVADLAVLLELGLGELAWLADARGLERRAEPEALRNYTDLWLPRPAGPPRVIERPKARLKAVQRRILRAILDPIPPHEAAHGFRRGRSARTHAAAHTGRRVVLRFDPEDFFASVPAGPRAHRARHERRGPRRVVARAPAPGSLGHRRPPPAGPAPRRASPCPRGRPRLPRSPTSRPSRSTAA